MHVTTANCAEVPQYLLVSDRVALVPAHTAKIFLERFPTLDVCEISFQMSRWSFFYRNVLFENKLFCRAEKVMKVVLAIVDRTIWTVALH